jgi:hypothetical protein
MSIPSETTSRLLAAVEIIAGSNHQGSEFITNTTLRSGSYTSIVIIADTVFETLTGNHDGWSGQTYPAGVVLSGIFSAIKLTSGKVIAYRR